MKAVNDASTGRGVLSGRRILVTGASGGIGSAICRALHRDGARLAVHYESSRERAEALARDGDCGSVALQADLTSSSGPDELWDAAKEALGTIDTLINNAGGWIASPLEPKARWVAGWEDSLNLNLRSAAWLTRRAILDFVHQGGGSIVSIASRSGLRGDDADHLAYGVAKAGLQNLMKSVAQQFASKGVLAYAIAPANVATSGTVGGPTTEQLVLLPLGELVPATDVAETVAFLVSGRARHLTGATLDITGADYVR